MNNYSFEDGKLASNPQRLFLEPTYFCDHEHPHVRLAVQNILQGSTQDPVHRTQILFRWVRDQIKYTLGLGAVPASETLSLMHGSCSNKANLLVAFLRAAGIPAGFHIYEVRTKEYFGATSIPRLNRFFSEKSLHVFSAVHLNRAWLALDATDDIRLSLGVQHITSTGRIVDFDGQSDARLHIHPSHILSATSVPVPDIDFVFQKKRRIPDSFVQILNVYLDFLRLKGIFYSSTEELEKEFILWLQSHSAPVWEDLCSIESESRVAHVPLEETPLESRSLSYSGISDKAIL